MAQEEKAKEPTVTFQAKAGFPADPKPMEVHAGGRRHQALGRRQLGAVRADGQAPPALGGAAQGHRAREVHLRRQAAGDALRPDDRGRGRRRRDRLDRHLEGRGPARREGGLDGRLADRPLRRAGRGRGGRRLARGRDGRGPPREGHLQGEALHPRAARGDEGRRPARLRPRQEPGGPGRPPQGQRGRPDRRGRAAAAATSRRASPRPRSSTRGRTTAPSTPTPTSRPTASWPRGRATSSPSTPRPRASSPCARASPRRSASTARTCA